MKIGRRGQTAARTLLVALMLALTSCQGRGEALAAPASTVGALSTARGAATIIPSPGMTIRVTATAATEPTLESTSTAQPTPTPLPPPFLDQFVSSLINGQPKQVVGVFVDGVMALKVVQQPASNPAYVSTVAGVATYYTLVTKMTGNSGLLAHNYLAGIYYYKLRPGQSVILIHGDGATTEYIVSDIDSFQALSPNSPTSNFVNVSTGETISAADLFYQVYGGSSRTTFQTCIAQGNDSSWGRLFVIAPHE